MAVSKAHIPIVKKRMWYNNISTQLQIAMRCAAQTPQSKLRNFFLQENGLADDDDVACSALGEQARNGSTVIKAIDINAWHRTGENQRGSIIVSGEGSRDRWLCLRYVLLQKLLFYVGVAGVSKRGVIGLPLCVCVAVAWKKNELALAVWVSMMIGNETHAEKTTKLDLTKMVVVEDSEKTDEMVLYKQHFRLVMAAIKRHVIWCRLVTKLFWCATRAMWIFYSCIIRLLLPSKFIHIYSYPLSTIFNTPVGGHLPLSLLFLLLSIHSIDWIE